MAIQVVKIREFTGHSQAVYTICQAGPTSFYSGGGDAMLVKWDMAEPDGLLIARHDAAIYAILQLEDRIYTGTQKGTITVIDATGKDAPRQVNPGCGPVFDLVFFEGNLLAASGNGQLIVIDTDTLDFKKIDLSDKSLRRIIVTDAILTITGSDGMIRRLDRDFNVLDAFRSHELSVFALAYLASEDLLISGGRDASLKVFRGTHCIQSINAHLLHIHDIRLNEAQTMFLTCSMDKHIKLWEASGQRLLKVIDHEKHGGHTSSVNKILWFGKNNFISCSDDRTLKCFEIQEK
jgi:WD40 repeat protein